MGKQLTILLILTSTFLTSTLIHAEDGWIDLFDGKSLSGWKPSADEAAYTVTEGELRLQATDGKISSHLFYVGDDDELDLFKDFELEVVARAEGNSNSGIFFHSDMETRNRNGHLSNGYEVQLNSTEKEKRKTGSLYDVVDVSESLVDDTEGVTVRIRVEGKRIQVWVNDIQTVDYTEPGNVAEQRQGRVLRDSGGAIALQAHDEDSIFFFKSVRIKPLP
ncbi:MAG: DUF1080 domain-containing protein [Verrucomicrobiota bacterium]